MIVEEATEPTAETPVSGKEDLGYLRLKRWFDEFLPRIRDEKRHPIDRLDKIQLLLRPAVALYENRFTVEIAELTALRDDIKRSLNVL
jgi:hypothetical protein